MLLRLHITLVLFHDGMSGQSSQRAQIIMLLCQGYGKMISFASLKWLIHSFPTKTLSLSLTPDSVCSSSSGWLQNNFEALVPKRLDLQCFFRYKVSLCWLESMMRWLPFENIDWHIVFSFGMLVIVVVVLNHGICAPNQRTVAHCVDTTWSRHKTSDTAHKVILQYYYQVFIYSFALHSCISYRLYIIL